MKRHERKRKEKTGRTRRSLLSKTKEELMGNLRLTLDSGRLLSNIQMWYPPDLSYRDDYIIPPTQQRKNRRAGRCLAGMVLVVVPYVGVGPKVCSSVVLVAAESLLQTSESYSSQPPTDTQPRGTSKSSASHVSSSSSPRSSFPPYFPFRADHPN